MRVLFTHTGHSHLVGNFSAGDTYAGSEDVCRHFVESARCAVWLEAPSAPAIESEATTGDQAGSQSKQEREEPARKNARNSKES